MNLFLATRTLTPAREDHLTEFFAASLVLFEDARRSLFDIAIRPFAEASQWGDCHITSVQTQHCFDDTDCRPDMLLTLSNGKLIACENKLEAPETPGPEQDDRAQLERYLDLPINGLLYVRSSWKPPHGSVLRNAKYIRPERREHFLWADFYSLFEGSSEPFLAWMKEGFERLGFTPPHPWIGELEKEAERRNFAKFWAKTKSFAHSLGWSVSTGSITELYLNDNRKTDADWIYIRPSPTRFLFRVTPKCGKRERCFGDLARACGSFPYPLEHGVQIVRRSEGEETVYEIEATAANILGEGPPAPETVENRLFQFVCPLLSAIQRS